ncbi:MAG: hypothetical protein RLZZ267_1210 [Bacillota bacterium]|jgi:cyclic lactone autoinducer peptide
MKFKRFSMWSNLVAVLVFIAQSEIKTASWLFIHQPKLPQANK